MRFVCDSTVGKLARLLRMAGFDTVHVRKEDLPKVLAVSREESRTILTRNSRYLGMTLATDLCLLEMDEQYDQFRQVILVNRQQLDPANYLTRCLECNERLIEVTKASVADRLYPFVAKTQEHIFRCPTCDKLYWHATHAKAIIAKLTAISEELARGSSESNRS